MILSPRALLGAAPAFVVIVGSFMLSRDHAREAKMAETGAANEVAVHTETIIWPSAEDEERLHRVALKGEAVDDLLEGRLTLVEVVGRFETISGLADSRQAVRQVLSFARVRADREPERFAGTVARLESEALLLTAATATPN